jgi:hypothetical protein
VSGRYGLPLEPTLNAVFINRSCEEEASPLLSKTLLISMLT